MKLAEILQLKYVGEDGHETLFNLLTKIEKTGATHQSLIEAFYSRLRESEEHNILVCEIIMHTKY